MEVSGSYLAELTGKAWRTVKKRLVKAGIQPVRQDGAADYYDSTAALPALYLEADIGQLDATRERARKDKEMADKLAMENDVRRRELLPQAEVIETIGGVIGDANSRLVQLPHVVEQVCPREVAVAVAALVRKYIYEIIDDLGRGSARVLAGTSDPDGERVGRRGKKAVGGGERGTGAVAD